MHNMKGSVVELADSLGVDTSIFNNFKLPSYLQGDMAALNSKEIADVDDVLEDELTCQQSSASWRLRRQVSRQMATRARVNAEKFLSSIAE
jgi:hypothetical protein